MIEEVQEDRNFDIWRTKYNYVFTITGKIEDILEERDELQEAIIEQLVGTFDTELRLKLGYEYEGHWVKK